MSTMSTAASLAPNDGLIRIKPNQILCAIDGCEKASSFNVHRFFALARPAKLVYCEPHGNQLASELGVGLPDDAG
jgi:hypothetical protein